MTTLNAAISAIADQSANRFYNITRAFGLAVAARAEGDDTVEVFASIAAAAKSEIAAATIVVANAEMYEAGCAEEAACKIAELQRILAEIAKLQTIAAPAAEAAAVVLAEQIAELFEDMQMQISDEKDDDACSWYSEEGVILSQGQAKMILQILKAILKS